MQYLEPIGGTTGFLVVMAVLLILSNLANTRWRWRSRRTSASARPERPNRRRVQRAHLKVVSNSKPQPPKASPNEATDKKAPFVPRGVSYRRRTLFTAIELEAFHFLKGAIGDAAHICAKVRVADCLDAHSKHVFSQTVAFRRIALKHVDFVVIRNDGAICFALEVDDSSHQRSDRRASDLLKDQAFFDAEVPLIRVEPYRLHESAELRRAIETLSANAKSTSGTPSASVS
jgi:hypothetical protein